MKAGDNERSKSTKAHLERVDGAAIEGLSEMG